MAEVICTKDNFQVEVLESDKPVLVDFWASWCGPCQMMGPVVAEIAEEHPEYKVCKVNVDEQQELGMQFNVMSIPFFAVFKKGKLTNSTVGAQSKESLIDLLK
ncbi:MAG: thioredoxin [Treponema sp.]|nr:thioredoxin [Treponema sp.]